MNTTHMHPAARTGTRSSHRTAAHRHRRLERMLAVHAMSSRPEATAQRTGSDKSLHIDRILVPLDFSESSVDALRFALPFARETGARLDVLHVIQPVPAAFGPPGEGGYLPPIPDKQQQRAAAARLKRLAAVEVQRPVRANTLVKEGAPARAINEAAAELRSNLLILSTHGYTGLKRFFLGSTAEAVVRRAPCPVLTVRKRVLTRQGTPQSPPSERINRILVPVDFSAPSREMLKYAVAFATQFRASLVLLHVVDRINVSSRVAYYATQLQMTVLHGGITKLAEWVRRLVPVHIHTEQIVRAGEPYDVIRGIARRERTDLIIIATRGHGALKRFFIGGTAGRVVRHAPCPVLVVR